MNNQAFSKIWIIIVLIILIGGGLLAWQYFGKPASIAILTECENIVTFDRTVSDDLKTVKCYLDKVIEKREKSLCSDPKVRFDEKICIATIDALENEDPTLCDSLFEKGYCYGKLAISLND